MAETSQSIGQRLKDKREAMGLSLMDISEVTKLSVRQLSSLERDAFKELPGDIYVWLFLRTYAKHLGFDIQEIKRLYEEVTRPAATAASERPVSRPQGRASVEAGEGAVEHAAPPVEGFGRPSQDDRSLGAPRTTPHVLAYGAVALAVIGVAFILAQFPLSKPATFEPSKRGTETLSAGGGTLAVGGGVAAAPVATSLVKPKTPPPAPVTGGVGQGSPVPDSGKGPSVQPAAQKKSEGLLRVKAKAPTWFEITVDGKDQWSTSMKPGEERIWLARKSFRVWIGYPPGLELSLNGNPLILNSPQGEPLRDVEIFPDGRVEYHLSSVDAP